MTKRVCIKIGSNVLTEDSGLLDISRIAHIVRQIKSLYDQGIEVFLISSGAVAAGRRFIEFDKKADIVSQRQVCSAVGQVHLINLYQRLFSEYGITCSQVLVTRHDFKDRTHYLNMRNALTAMSSHKILPIINENDTVAVTELMFTDNDELAGMLSTMLNADKLIILSNIDGLYSGPPDHPESELISEINADNDDFSHVVSTSKSSFGRGGMHTKYRISCETAKSGTDVYIANGRKKNIVCDIVAKKPVLRTRFTASNEAKSRLKNWIQSSKGYAKAKVKIDSGAEKALLSDKANSLLLVGVTEIDGSFKRGDIIEVVNERNHLIAIGSAGISSTTAAKHIGKRYSHALIHYDYLCLT